MQWGLGMIHEHDISCTRHCYYYISSTPDHQASDPRGWGPLLQGFPFLKISSLLCIDTPVLWYPFPLAPAL